MAAIHSALERTGVPPFDVLTDKKITDMICWHAAFAVGSAPVLSQAVAAAAGNQKQPAVVDSAAAPANSNPSEQLAVQNAVIVACSNMHAVDHRPTCFKKTGAKEKNGCRFKIPHLPCDECGFDQVIGADGRLIGIRVDTRRRVLFLYLTPFNAELSHVFRSNNNIQYVRDSKTGFYIAMYMTKQKKEHTLGFLGAIQRLDSHFQRMARETQRAAGHSSSAEAVPRPAPPMANANVRLPNELFRSFLGALRSGVRGLTDENVVCGQVAAFLLLNEELLFCSHEFVAMRPESMIEYLCTGQLNVTITRNRRSNSAIMDYMYRPASLEKYSWYEFLSRFKTIPLPKTKPKQKNSEKSTTRNNRPKKRARTSSAAAAASASVIVEDEPAESGGGDDDEPIEATDAPSEGKTDDLNRK
jgi:hypothetical protein